MFNLGVPELLIVLVVVLVLFGAKRVPEVARSLGQSINAFKSGIKEASHDPEAAKTEAKTLTEESKT